MISRANGRLSTLVSHTSAGRIGEIAMRIGRRSFARPAFLLLSLSWLVSCAGLAKVHDDDGADKGNPLGPNPGTQTLVIGLVATTPGVNDTVHALRVGDSTGFWATYPGASGSTPQLSGIVWSTSDSSVAAPVVKFTCCVLATYSAGTVTITGTWFGMQATTSAVIVPNDAGISALLHVVDSTNSWLPSSVRVQVGSRVKFGVGPDHNVVFANVPGAPANIALGSTGADNVRLFSVAGSFAYQCSIHGEAGTVNVWAAP